MWHSLLGIGWLKVDFLSAVLYQSGFPKTLPTAQRERQSCSLDLSVVHSRCRGAVVGD